MVITIKSLIISLWLPHSSTTHIRKLRIVIFISGENGSDCEMDDVAKFLECHKHIIFSFAFHIAGLALYFVVVCMCGVIFMLLVLHFIHFSLMKLERLSHFNECMTTISEFQNQMCSTKFTLQRRHSLFTLLLKIARIWFIFTRNVHCNRIVAFILGFIIIHELNWPLIFFCCWWCCCYYLWPDKVEVYVILTKMKTTSLFFTALKGNEKTKQINNNKERNFCLQLNPYRIAGLYLCAAVFSFSIEFGLIKLN